MLSPYMVQKMLHSSELDENNISKQIIIPCLQKIAERNRHSQRDIRFVGGEHEQGSDIEYYEIIGPDRLRLYSGVQVKKRNISISESTKLIIQGTQAFEKNIIDPASGIPYRINRWIVATTGEISPPAKEEIYKALSRYGKLISFWDGIFLGELIVEHFHNEFASILKIDPLLTVSENVLVNLWDPNEPQELLKDFTGSEWTKVDISAAVPPIVSTGIFIRVVPIGSNMPSVKCLIRSSKDEVLIDSFLSQHNSYLLRIMPGENEVEVKLIEEIRPVNIFSPGYTLAR